MLSLSDATTPVRPGQEGQSDPEPWRLELRQAIRDPQQLCARLELPSEIADAAVERGFPLLAPRPYVQRMQPGDPDDPLLRQVMPTAAEASDDGLPQDAVGDLPAAKSPGLIQKYRGRALLVLSGQCAVNCRYCFRRHYPYSEAPKSDAQWEPALHQIERDDQLTEVILSGGDPLVLSDNRLRRVIERLDTVPHLKRLRVHTRLPVVIPQRVTDGLCALLNRSRLNSVVVLHVNHANEVDDQVALAAQQLQEAGALLLNQSVLLRGVNDSAGALATLSDRLIDIGVTPYYLHQLDRVAGVGHFEVPVGEGRRIVEALRKRLPGYAVPRYVQEIAGEPYKTLLA